MKRILLCLLLLVVGVPLSAQSVADLARASGGRQIGNVIYTRQVDPMTDADRSMVTVPPETREVSELVIVAWRCLSDGLNIVFGHKYLGGDSRDYIRVQWRFDSKPASSFYDAKLFSGSRSSWLQMDMVDTFTRQAKAGNKLILRVRDPLDGEILTNTYYLNGVTAALRLLPCAS